MKICVLGFSGSCKSTLARFLGERLNLPVLHLDCVFWYGDWQSRTREEQEIKVNEFIAANPESWVIDGNYLKIFRERAELCDEIYFLNFNRFFCYSQALTRYKKYKGEARPDLPCREKFDFEFKKWLLFDGRTKKRRNELKNFVFDAKGAVFEFKKQKDLEKFLKSRF